MDYEMTSILEIMAEMNSFSETNDDLSELVARYDSDEISENDLSFVSAAYSPPPFSEFLKRHL